MKKYKKIGSILLTLFFLCMINVTAFAKSELPNLDQKGSITVTVRDTKSQKTIAGGSLKIYQVALAKEADWDFTYEYSKDFEECEIPLIDIQSEGLASKLYQFVVSKNVKADSVKIGNDGKVVFSNLNLGLYLIAQDTAAKGYSNMKPFLVTVPLNDNGRYIYDVNAEPKAGTVTIQQETTETSTVTTETSTHTTSTSTRTTTTTSQPRKLASKLPQTGQLWWPVVVFAVAGVSSLMIGHRKKIK